MSKTQAVMIKKDKLMLNRTTISEHLENFDATMLCQRWIYCVCSKRDTKRPGKWHWIAIIRRWRSRSRRSTRFPITYLWGGMPNSLLHTVCVRSNYWSQLWLIREGPNKTGQAFGNQHTRTNKGLRHYSIIRKVLRNIGLGYLRSWHSGHWVIVPTSRHDQEPGQRFNRV